MSFHQGRGLFCAAMLLLAGARAESPANATLSNSATLSVIQILEQMERHNQSQKETLKHYRAVRHYEAEYRGYATTMTAKMEVEVNFDADSGKSFRIVSQSGSKLLCDRVTHGPAAHPLG